jgi:hypothetical protein
VVGLVEEVQRPAPREDEEIGSTDLAAVELLAVKRAERRVPERRAAGGGREGEPQDFEEAAYGSRGWAAAQ